MSLPKEYLRQAWQHACRLILSRAPVEAITRQLSLALFMDAALDLGHKRPQASSRSANESGDAGWRTRSPASPAAARAPRPGDSRGAEKRNEGAASHAKLLVEDKAYQREHCASQQNWPPNAVRPAMQGKRIRFAVHSASE
jgi:hypothetical protein